MNTTEHTERDSGWAVLRGLGILAVCAVIAGGVVYGLHLLAAYLLSR